MDSTTAMYVAQGIHGLAYGMILFLLASGLTLIFGMMGILNLAHAAFFMLSAYFGYQVLAWTGNFWLALLVAPVAAAILGVIMERFLLTRVHAFGHMGELILTVGISLIILDGVKTVWGTQNLPLGIPPVLQGLVKMGGLQYPVYRLFIIGLALVILLIMILVLYKTRLGMVVRAAVSDAEMVDALGVNVPLVFMFVFGAGTWLAGWRGWLSRPYSPCFRDWRTRSAWMPSWWWSPAGSAVSAAPSWYPSSAGCSAPTGSSSSPSTRQCSFLPSWPWYWP
jgi:branched-chain amino acid transport system permease protein